jgi:hypothetical protein
MANSHQAGRPHSPASLSAESSGIMRMMRNCKSAGARLERGRDGRGTSRAWHTSPYRLSAVRGEKMNQFQPSEGLQCPNGPMTRLRAEALHLTEEVETLRRAKTRSANHPMSEPSLGYELISPHKSLGNIMLPPRKATRMDGVGAWWSGGTPQGVGFAQRTSDE